jgi:hypothetical protein
LSEKFNKQIISHNNQHYSYQTIPNNSFDFPPVNYHQYGEERAFTPTPLPRTWRINANDFLVNGRFRSDVVLCPSDRPCIQAVYKEGANLIVEWIDTQARDHYNLRWSRPGRQVRQLELPGGRGGRFTLTNFRSNTPYTFAVQGCRFSFIIGSQCTPWYEVTVTR